MLQLVDSCHLPTCTKYPKSLFLKNHTLLLSSLCRHKYLTDCTDGWVLAGKERWLWREKAERWIGVLEIPIFWQMERERIIMRRTGVGRNDIPWCPFGSYRTTWRTTNTYSTITGLVGLSRKLSSASSVGIMKHSTFGRKWKGKKVLETL